MIALILCGGRSLRMGSDKGLLTSNGETWAHLAAKKLQAIKAPVKYSINNDQETTYLKIFQPDELILDNETLAIGGPLKGILSAHLSATSADIFVLACDLVRMNITLPERLLKEKKQQPDFDVYAFTNNDFYEPLCAIYTAKGLSKIATMYREGKLKTHSLQFVLNQLQTCKIALPLADRKYFENFNSPSSVKGL